MNRKMKIVDLVTPSRGNEGSVATGMVSSPLQSQSLAAINDLNNEAIAIADGDYSPKMSPLRRHEVDQTPLGDQLQK